MLCDIDFPETPQKSPQKRPFGKQNDANSLKTLYSWSVDWRENQTDYENSVFTQRGAKHTLFSGSQSAAFPKEGME
jgi:hypothetical protein